MSENERVRQIRKAKGLTQERFGNQLGLKRAAISLIESGASAVTNQVRLAICREYGVREEWLREGTGEMFVKQSRDDQIAKFFHDISFEDAGFKRQFVAMLARLTEDEWALLERKARELITETDKEKMEKADQ